MMTSWLKQSTTVTVRLGPFLDKTDGVTEETGAAPTVEVSKNHAAFGARNSATAITHDSNGWFAVELNGTDTGTVGPLIIKADSAADFLPVWREFMVVPAAVYDSLVGGTDTLPADVTQWNGTNVATPDTAGYPKTTAKVGTGAGEINLSGGKVPATIAAGDMATDSVTAATMKADAVTKIQSGLATAAAVTTIDDFLDTEIAALIATIGAAGAGLTALGDARLANLDALISSRSTYSGADTAGVTTLLTRITALLQTKAEADAAHALLATAAALVTAQADLDELQARLPADPADASVVAGQITLAKREVIDIVESQRGGHTHAGIIVYVDGTGGSDTTGDGSRSLPFATITKALTVCSANAHDLIILLPRAGQSPNVITEAAGVTINKNYTFIRGPGRDVRVTRVGAGPVITIAASGVELSGFQVSTAGAASNAVQVSSSDFARLFRLWIDSATQDGVNVAVGTNCRIEQCAITAAARDGVRVESGAGSGYYCRITDGIIRDSGGSAINLQGADASDSQIQRNVIRDNAVGITLSSGVSDTVITDNRMVNNVVPISDLGTRTLQMWNSLATDMTGNLTGSLAIPGGTSLTPAGGATLTTGTQAAGTYASTVALDGTTHQINSVGNALEIYYEFQIGDDGLPVLVKHTGYLLSANDTLSVWAYNWGGAAWVQIGDYEGQAGAVNVARTYDLLSSYVGTGGDAGKVRIRFYAASGLSTASLHTDQILVGFTQSLTDVASQADLLTLTGLVDPSIADILERTANLPDDPADQSSLAALVAAVPDDVWTALDATIGNRIADIILRRNLDLTEVGGQGDTTELLSLYGLVLAILNAAATVTTLTVKHPGGTTLGTAALTRDSNAKPVSGVDG